MKFKHFLRGSKSLHTPQNVICVDTETIFSDDSEVSHHFLRLGSAVSVRLREDLKNPSEKWCDFWNVEEFWDFLEDCMRPKQKYYLYAHNMHFDFMVLDGLRCLKERGWELKSWFVTSSVFMMTYKKGSCKLEVVDSGNILKAKLDSIGEKMGLPKLDVDFSDVSDKDLLVYCRRDVEILKRWVLSFMTFVVNHRLGCYRKTLAGQSFEGFKHRFLQSWVLVHNNEDAYHLEREAYKGGRTECFFIGEMSGERFSMIDVNSMYPFVMKKFKYPRMLCFFSRNVSVSQLRGLLKDYLCIAKVRIKISSPCIALHRARTIFPVGTFTVSLTTPELKWVLRHGEILEVFEVSCYDSADLFTSYVDYFYNLKNEAKSSGDGISYLIAKLFMNSLYGKFGQKSSLVEEVGKYKGDFNKMCTEVDEQGNVCNTAYISGKIWRISEAVGESFDSFPAIAAHVTAYARMYMHELIMRVGYDRVFYCDTDSLLVRSSDLAAFADITDPLKLGNVGVECETEKILIRGLKDYDLGVESRIKGVKKSAVEVAPSVFRQDQFMKFRGLLRKGVSNHAIVRSTLKHLRRQYEKGVVGEDGFVSPYVFSEEATS